MLCRIMSGLTINVPENRREWNRLHGGLEGDEFQQNLSDTWRKQTGGNYRTYVETRRRFMTHKHNPSAEVQNGNFLATGLSPVTSIQPVSTREENVKESPAHTHIVKTFCCKNCYRPLSIGNSSTVSRDNKNQENVTQTILVNQSRCQQCAQRSRLSKAQPINRTSYLLE